MSKLSKEAKKRLLIVAAYIITTIAITLLLLPWIRQLSTNDGRIVMKQRVESYGAFAPMIYILLHVFHVIIAFVPGEPIELLGGVLFGTIPGTLYGLLGVIIGTAVVFLLVRKFGRPLVGYFVPEEKIKNHRLLQDENKLEWAVFLLFFIPGTPKDLLTYLDPDQSHPVSVDRHACPDPLHPVLRLYRQFLRTGQISGEPGGVWHHRRHRTDRHAHQQAY